MIEKFFDAGTRQFLGFVILGLIYLLVFIWGWKLGGWIWGLLANYF